MKTNKLNKEFYTLSEISMLTGIGQNTLRYHLKKMARFFRLQRDRYNRFLFTKEDIRRLEQIDQLKQNGIDYLGISMRLFENTPPQNESFKPNNTTTVPFEEKRNEISEIKDKIEQEIQKNVYLREANHILYEKNSELEKKISELREKIESLEQRVGLLIEFQAKFMTGNSQ